MRKTPLRPTEDSPGGGRLETQYNCLKVSHTERGLFPIARAHLAMYTERQVLHSPPSRPENETGISYSAVATMKQHFDRTQRQSKHCSLRQS